MSKRLRKKIALISGAANGIGYATANLFAQEGASLILIDISGEILAKRKHEIEEAYDVTVLDYSVDISDRKSVNESVADAVAKLGQIDVLVNNAGRNFFADPRHAPEKHWDECFQVNLSGTWNCCRAVLPHMQKSKHGSIVNIASIHAHRIVKNSFPYPVFKHGLLGLTRSLGIEFAADGVRVNSVSPGLIQTPGTEAYFDGCENSEQERAELISRVPLGRIGRASEVANAVLFLASDEAQFITATDILVDGGATHKYAG